MSGRSKSRDGQQLTLPTITPNDWIMPGQTVLQLSTHGLSSEWMEVFYQRMTKILRDSRSNPEEA